MGGLMPAQAGRADRADAWPARDRQALHAAAAALARGDHPAAERIARALLPAHPRSADLHRLIATACRRRGNLPGAAAAYRAAEAVGPEDAGLLVDHAATLDRLGDFAQAIDRYRRALALAPGHPAALLGWALALHHSGRPDAALSTIADALSALPQDAALWQARGAILRDLGEADAAAAAFARALQLSPGSAPALRGLVKAQEEAGQPASPAYRHALSRRPGDRPLQIGLAVAEAAEGMATQAIARLAMLADAAPDWVEGQETLARLRWQHGHDTESDETDGARTGDAASFDRGFHRAVAGAPRNGALWVAWLRLLARAGQHGQVARIAAQARAAAGPSPAIDLAEAGSASAAGDIDRADRLFSGIAQQMPDALAPRLAHLLRAGRAGQAAALAHPLLSGPLGAWVAPYLDAAWRLLGDPRAEWLSGQTGLIGTASLSVDLDRLATLLRSLHAARRAPLDQSLRHGTQTEGPLLSRAEPILRELRAAIIAAAERFAASLPHDPAHPFLRRQAGPVRVSGSWSVRLQGGGHHVAHVHSAGWVSSAFYVALPPSTGEDAGALTLGQPPADLAPGLPAREVIRPQAGMLVLFPSLMWHGTQPFPAGERLTAAFDFVPRA